MENLPKNCSEVRGNLPLYVGRDLDASEIESVKSHLADCRDCRHELQAAESARTALLSLHGEDLSNAFLFDLREFDEDFELDLWPGIQSQLASEGLLKDVGQAATLIPAKPALRLLPRLTGSRVALVGAAAAALVLAWFGFFANSDKTLVSPAGTNSLVAESTAGLNVPPNDASVSDPVLIETDVLAAKSGGLRPIGQSEALRGEARIFHPDVPDYLPPSSLLQDNPNRAAGNQLNRAVGGRKVGSH